ALPAFGLSERMAPGFGSNRFSSSPLMEPSGDQGAPAGKKRGTVPQIVSEIQGLAAQRGTTARKTGCHTRAPKTVCRQGLARKPAPWSAGFLYLALRLPCL